VFFYQKATISGTNWYACRMCDTNLSSCHMLLPFDPSRPHFHRCCMGRSWYLVLGLVLYRKLGVVRCNIYKESAEVTTSSSFQDISNEDLLMNDTSANSDRSEFPLHCPSPLKSAPIKKLDNKLRSVCLNIESIKSKREALWNLLDSNNPDILFGCETWLLV
jgi:hypothetical protein